MTLLTVIQCLDSGEKVYRAKTTLTARTTIETEAARWILESSIRGSKNRTVFFFFFFCIYHNAVVKCLLCVYHSVALEKYRDVLSLPELSLARETESCYVYWYRSVVISLPPPPAPRTFGDVTRCILVITLEKGATGSHHYRPGMPPSILQLPGQPPQQSSSQECQ